MRRRIRDLVSKDLGSSPLLGTDPVRCPGSQCLPSTELMFAHLYQWVDVSVMPQPAEASIQPSLHAAG